MAETTSLCLSCLGNENIFNIFDTHECDGQEEIYADMLKSCFDITISKESCVNGMCENCILVLREANAFKLNVIKTVKELETRLSKLELDPKTGQLWMYIIETTKYNTNSTTEKKTSEDNGKTIDKIKDKNAIKHGNTGKNREDDSKRLVSKEVINKNSQVKVENNKYVEKIEKKTKIKVSDVKLAPLKCSQCGKQFPDKTGMARHVKTHLKGPFPCGTCGQVFSKLNSRNAHVWRVHNTREPYVCSECGQRFTTFYKRLSHLHHTHGLKAEYPCPYCDNKYFYAGSRSKHIRSTHLKVRNHNCTECAMGFYKRRGLLSHMATIHGIGEKQHVCSICGKSFYRNTTLRAHLQRHADKVKKEIYKCSECSASFTHKGALTNHLKKHAATTENIYFMDESPEIFHISSEHVDQDIIVEDEILEGSNDTVYFEIGENI